MTKRRCVAKSAGFLHRFIAGWLMLLVVLTYVPSAEAKTTADEYTSYVDKAIVFSREIAQQNSRAAELSVFITQASNANSYFQMASDASVVVDRLSPYLTQLPKTQGEPSKVMPLLQQRLLVSQVLNAADTVTAALAGYRRLTDDVGKACDKSFDQYNADNLYTGFKEPNIETVDGIYIVFDPLLPVSIGESLIQIFNNKGEQTQIRADSERLRRDGVSTAEYQAYARASCNAYVPVFASYLHSYEPLFKDYEKWVTTVSIESLRRQDAALKEALNQYSIEFVAAREGRASDAVAALFADTRDRDLLKSLERDLRLKTTTLLHILANSQCTTLPHIAAALSQNMAIARLYKLTSSNKLQVAVAGAVRTHQASCTVSQQNANLVALRGRKPLHVNISWLLQNVFSSPAEANEAIRPISQCTFDQHTASTFCGFMHSREFSHQYGSLQYDIRTSGSSGLCESVSGASISSYTSCYGNSAIGLATGTSWTSVRDVVAHAPGVYSAERGEQTKAVLDDSLRDLAKTRDSAKDITATRLKGQSDYYSATIPLAIYETRESLEVLTTRVTTSLTLILASAPACSIAPCAVPKPVTDAYASSPIRELSRAGDTGDQSERLKTANEVSLVVHARAEDVPGIPSADRLVLSSIEARVHDHYGLLNGFTGWPTARSCCERYRANLDVFRCDDTGIRRKTRGERRPHTRCRGGRTTI
jgi:hypothetical protein